MGKRKIIISFAVAAVALGAIGITFALSNDSSVFENSFGLSGYETEFTDVFNSPTNWMTCDEEPKTFVVKNNSDAPVSVRVKISESWKSSSGRTLNNASNIVHQSYATINFANQSDWTKRSYDGVQYYVYNTDLQPGSSTSTLLSSVTFNCNIDLGVETDYNNAEYHLLLTAQTIQADKKPDVWRTRATWGSLSNVLSNITTTRTDCGATSGSGTISIYACIKKLERSSTSPVGVVPNSSIRGMSGAKADFPILVWASDDYRTLYWYTEADDVYFPQDCSFLFSNMSDLTTLDSLEDVITSEVNNMYYMFNYDHDLTDISAVEKWDVSHVTDMRYMFFYSMLDSIEPLRKWDVSSVTNMDKMLTQDAANYNIPSAEPLSGWNVSNVTNMDGLFWHFEEFDASSLDNWTLNENVHMDAQTFGCDNVITPSWFSRDHSPCS